MLYLYVVNTMILEQYLSNMVLTASQTCPRPLQVRWFRRGAFRSGRSGTGYLPLGPSLTRVRTLRAPRPQGWYLLACKKKLKYLEILYPVE